MNRLTENLGAWLRGLIWIAMAATCAAASAQGDAQSYLVQPSSGHVRTLGLVGPDAAIVHAEAVDGAGQKAEALPKDDLFAGTEVFSKNATNVTEVTMDPDTLNLVGGPDARRAHNMVLNIVRTYQYDKPGMYNMADVEAIRSKLNSGDWHCSVHVRDLKNGSGTDVCNKRRTDGMKETAIIEVEAKQLTFIHTIRRTDGPGSSELGFFPMIPGLHGLPLLAMMDPEALASMPFGAFGMGGAMPFSFVPNIHILMRDGNGDLKALNSPEMKQRMQELHERLKDLKVPPVDPEQMERLNQQMKNFNHEFFNGDNEASPAVPAPPQPPAAPQSKQ